LVVGTAWGSIVDPRKGQKATPEQSQGQVAKQQALQGTFGRVGMVPRDTEVYVPPGAKTDDAAAGVIALSAQGTTHSDPNAAKVLAEASTHLKQSAGSPVKTFGWGLLFLALGFGVVMGLRQWVVKNIPEPAPSKTHVEW
jgi:hypothetical protein